LWSADAPEAVDQDLGDRGEEVGGDRGAAIDRVADVVEAGVGNDVRPDGRPAAVGADDEGAGLASTVGRSWSS
jgi:hypothetical protein